MRNNPILFFIILLFILFIVDFYTYKGVKKVLKHYKDQTKKIIKLIYWVIPGLIIFGVILIVILRSSIPPEQFIILMHTVSGSFLLFYIPKIIFILFNLIDDLVKALLKLFTKIRYKGEIQKVKARKISRSKFLAQIGIITAGIPFLAIAYGIAWGRFDLIVRKLKLNFDNLPKSFNGFRVVQISDFHIGSLLNHEAFVNEIVERINSLKPDLILFTGDMVNNLASEMDKFLPILKLLNSKFGVFSVLGNHDYGEYVRWESEADKNNNLNKVIENQRQCGLDILLNENRKIQVGEEFIELIGVENWGLPPFPQYGDLNKALLNTEEKSFKILMSHDPTHWDEQVLGSTNIDLTLSGHTHGAQFGIEIPGWRWSPVNIRYKRWGGLYEEGRQKLYVNTGVGFIGFPGRVGMPPEITLIELTSS